MTRTVCAPLFRSPRLESAIPPSVSDATTTVASRRRRTLPGYVRTGRLSSRMAVEFSPQRVEHLLAFDDVLLVPTESRVLPNDVSTATRLTRSIRLEIPVVSAAMDTVTEARLAIAL